MLELQPPSTSPLPRIVAGRYQVLGSIGRGGRSVVYAAQDPLLNREVAVKIFHISAASPAELKIQEAEARLAASLNHHALTTLFDAGIDTSDPARPSIYLVMERIPGVDLRKHIAAHGPMTAAQVAYLGFDLAEGLQYLHEHGFLHRDIKPANVLIADRRSTPPAPPRTSPRSRSRDGTLRKRPISTPSDSSSSTPSPDRPRTRAGSRSPRSHACTMTPQSPTRSQKPLPACCGR